MLKRDFVLVLICLGIAYVAFQRESWIEFRPNWYFEYPYEKNDDFIISNDDFSALPTVGDLNGDGHFEVLVPTKDSKIKVISPPRHPAQTSKIVGLLKANEIGQINLQGGDILQFKAGFQPVAIKTGYLESPQSLAQPIRKQVIAVMTERGILRLYNHQFNLLWEQNLAIKMPHHATIKEVDLIVSNHSILTGDKGCVIAGISVHNKFSSGNQFQDPFLDQKSQNEMREDHARTHFGADNLTEIGGQSGIDTSTHFQMYALNGQDGSIRWHNRGSDFHRDVANVRDDVLPQQHYKLNAKSLEGRKYGEESCRHYRTSLLASLPHRWRDIGDTTLVLAHYQRQNQGIGADPKKLVSRHKHRSSSYNPHLAISQSEQTSSRLNQGLQNFVSSQNNKQVRKGDQIESQNKLKASQYQNLDYQDFKYHEHQYAHNYPHTISANPNVIVAHLKEGLQVFHLFTGQPICKIYFPPGGYNVDIDGDGILDQVSSFGDQFHSDQNFQYLRQVIQEKLRYAQAGFDSQQKTDNAVYVQPKCVGWVNSGIPPTMHKFNQSICRRGTFNIGSLSFGSALQHIEEEQDTQDLQVATPVSLPVPIGGKYYKANLIGQPYQALFLTSQGLLSAFTEDGFFLWQAQLQIPQDRKILKPYLDVIPLVQGGVPLAIVAGGDQFIQVLSENGQSLNRIVFEEEMHQLKFQDYSGDHLVDIIAIGKNKVYGYTQIRNPSSEPITIIILILMGAMVLIYLSQNNQNNQIFQSLGRRVYKLEPKDE